MINAMANSMEGAQWRACVWCVCVCSGEGVMEEMTSEPRVAGTWSLRWPLTYLCRCLWNIRDLLTGMGDVQFPQASVEL